MQLNGIETSYPTHIFRRRIEATARLLVIFSSWFIVDKFFIAIIFLSYFRYRLL